VAPLVRAPLVQQPLVASYAGQRGPDVGVRPATSGQLRVPGPAGGPLDAYGRGRGMERAGAGMERAGMPRSSSKVAMHGRQAPNYSYHPPRDRPVPEEAGRPAYPGPPAPRFGQRALSPECVRPTNRLDAGWGRISGMQTLRRA